MNDARVRKLQRELKQLEAERADRVRRGAPVPTWFDHMLDKRRTQLIDATRSVPIEPPRVTLFQRIWRTLA